MTRNADIGSVSRLKVTLPPRPASVPFRSPEDQDREERRRYAAAGMSLALALCSAQRERPPGNRGSV